MNLNKIAAVGTRALSKSTFVAKKFSPEILTGVGIAGVVVAGVLVAKQTLKLEETVNEIEKDMAPHKETLNLIAAGQPTGMATKDVKRDLSRVYVQSGIKIVKLYWQPVTLGVVSIGCILGGQHILRKRNVAVVAAYKILEEGYTEYRRRVVEEIGEEKEAELRLGLRAVDADDTVNDDGSKVVTPKTELKKVSPYAEIFDRSNVNWSEDADDNMYFLQGSQNVFNERLRGRGHIFLNEVLRHLGFDETPAGALTGWILNSETGDGHIDYGFRKMENIRKGAKLDGHEGHIFLDFNVDGEIWDKI